MEEDEGIPTGLVVLGIIAFMIYQIDPNIISHIHAAVNLLGAAFNFIINAIIVIFVIVIVIWGYTEVKNRF